MKFTVDLPPEVHETPDDEAIVAIDDVAIAPGDVGRRHDHIHRDRAGTGDRRRRGRAGPRAGSRGGDRRASPASRRCPSPVVTALAPRPQVPRPLGGLHVRALPQAPRRQARRARGVLARTRLRRHADARQHRRLEAGARAQAARGAHREPGRRRRPVRPGHQPQGRRRRDDRHDPARDGAGRGPRRPRARRRRPPRPRDAGRAGDRAGRPRACATSWSWPPASGPPTTWTTSSATTAPASRCSRRTPTRSRRTRSTATPTTWSRMSRSGSTRSC